MSHLQNSRVIKGSKFKVFDFLSSPDHLAEQLNGLIEVKWENPGVELKVGSEFLFLMTRFGIEQPIRFVVDKLVVGKSLTYKQVNGVFRRFTHTLRCEDLGGTETRVVDIIDYDLPFGIFGKLANDFYVRKDLKKILDYRLDRAEKRMKDDFEAMPKSEVSATSI